MSARTTLTLAVFSLLTLGHARAGSHGGGHVGGSGLGHHHSYFPAGIYAGGFGYVYPVLVVAPNGIPPFGGANASINPVTLVRDRGQLLAGPMPNGSMWDLKARPPEAGKKRGDPARSAQFVTLGDRLFKAGNTRRAEERFEQAIRADPKAAAPRVRLAQLALVRGQYAEAANQFREAQAAQPGWLMNAKDVQSLFAEPGDFARHIAKLETHLQANPADRDAWFTLGAEWFLSGRTKQASDIFVRLSDRAADPTLAAFRDASTPRETPSN